MKCSGTYGLGLPPLASNVYTAFFGETWLGVVPGLSHLRVPSSILGSKSPLRLAQLAEHKTVRTLIGFFFRHAVWSRDG